MNIYRANVMGWKRQPWIMAPSLEAATVILRAHLDEVAKNEMAFDEQDKRIRERPLRYYVDSIDCIYSGAPLGYKGAA